jgi:hypothetical protein
VRKSWTSSGSRPAARTRAGVSRKLPSLADRREQILAASPDLGQSGAGSVEEGGEVGVRGQIQGVDEEGLDIGCVGGHEISSE